MAGQRIFERDKTGAEHPAEDHFHGESLKSCQIPGFILSECRYPPHFETPLHAHGRALFCLAVEGAYTARYGPKTCTCEPSSLLFHAPNEMHSEHFQNSGGRFFIIEIEPWWLERVREQGGVIDFSSDFKGGSLAMFGMNLYQEYLFDRRAGRDVRLAAHPVVDLPDRAVDDRVEFFNDFRRLLGHLAQEQFLAFGWRGDSVAD